MKRHSGVLVTGGSRGIGRACCDALAKLGIPVISMSRTPPAQVPPTETHYCMDLSDIEGSCELVSQVVRSHNVSALICNAGRGDMGSLENFSSRQITSSIAMNLISPLAIARQCIPHFKSLDRSNLVFIGSTSALSGARYGSIYSAAKFGLRGAAQALSHELSGANCHVGIVNPGMVRTGFFDTLDFEPGPEKTHALDAHQVAESVMSLLQSPDNAVISEVVVQPRQHVVRKRGNRS